MAPVTDRPRPRPRLRRNEIVTKFRFATALVLAAGMGTVRFIRIPPNLPPRPGQPGRLGMRQMGTVRFLRIPPNLPPRPGRPGRLGMLQQRRRRRRRRRARRVGTVRFLRIPPNLPQRPAQPGRLGMLQTAVALYLARGEAERWFRPTDLWVSPMRYWRLAQAAGPGGWRPLLLVRAGSLACGPAPSAGRLSRLQSCTSQLGAGALHAPQRAHCGPGRLERPPGRAVVKERPHRGRQRWCC